MSDIETTDSTPGHWSKRRLAPYDVTPIHWSLQRIT